MKRILFTNTTLCILKLMPVKNHENYKSHQHVKNLSVPSNKKIILVKLHDLLHASYFHEYENKLVLPTYIAFK